VGTVQAPRNHLSKLILDSYLSKRRRPMSFDWRKNQIYALRTDVKDTNSLSGAEIRLHKGLP
jgi:hypothetical protein